MDDFRRTIPGRHVPLDPLDFDDVFGGPPRTATLRRGRRSPFPNRMRFYDHIFGAEDDDDFQPEDRDDMSPVPIRSPSRNLPVFEIPGSRRAAVRRSHGSYGDVSSLMDGSSSPYASGFRSKSTSARSSPLRPSVRDDVALSAVASKLKPINVSSQRHVDSCSEQNTHGNLTVASVGSYMEYTDPSTDCCKQSTYSAKFDQHHQSSPLSQTSHLSRNQQYRKFPYDKTYYNPEINSPSSVTTSTVHDPEVFVELSEKVLREDECEPEFDRNYMIEIVPQQKIEETDEVGAVDDAIAWVKERYRAEDLKNSELGKMANGRNSFSKREKARGEKHDLYQVSGAESAMQVMVESEVRSSCSKQPICSMLYNEDRIPRRSHEELLRKQMFYHEDCAHRRSHEDMFRKQMLSSEDYAHRRSHEDHQFRKQVLHNEDYAHRRSHEEQLRKQMALELMNKNRKMWSEEIVTSSVNVPEFLVALNECVIQILWKDDGGTITSCIWNVGRSSEINPL